MSMFFHEDLVAFKEDPSILALVNLTWSDIEHEPPIEKADFYFHENLPTDITDSWSRQGKLRSGYVFIEFMNVCDGYCLIHENSLQLVDRSLAAGDVVKRKSLDQQSGTVISTSVNCNVKPGRNLLQFCETSQVREPSPEAPYLEVSASELKDYGIYREEDFIIYKDWIGQISAITEDVTIRLRNGSVVTVQDPYDLRECCFDSGLDSLQLLGRLQILHYGTTSSRQAKIHRKSVAVHGSCHPGLIVSTKKANLRLGKWVLGAYDPNIEPSGIVVDTKCVVLDVDWLFPNIFRDREARSAPPHDLDLTDIDSDEILLYDRNRTPNDRLSLQLDNATYSPDIGFGRFVRFRDGAGAAAKYGRTAGNNQIGAYFDRILQVETQSFDINVLQVVKTSTKVSVQWQDGSVSEETATSLISYANPDDYDVWPGDKVSYQPQEETFREDGKERVRTRKVGVVQSVDSMGRLARVRWYENPLVEYEAQQDSYGIPTCKYGRIGDDISSVSLYELSTLIGTDIYRGNLVFVLPELPLVNSLDMSSYLNRLSDEHKVDLSGPLPLITPEATWLEEDVASEDYSHHVLIEQGIVQAMGLQSDYYAREVDGGQYAPDSERQLETACCFAEVIDLCLDGNLIVRLGASPDTPELKFAPERVLVISSGDTVDLEDDSWDDETGSSEFNENELTSSEVEEETEAEDSMEDESDDETDRSTSPIDIQIEYEGDSKAMLEDDADMWESDHEDENNKKPQTLDTSNEKQDDVDMESQKLLEDSTVPFFGEKHKAIPITNYFNIPDTFTILETSAPMDHHFINLQAPLSGEQMRRISKEYGILASSLPDGVFARSWEQRLDLLRILIVGSTGTPYEHAPFVMDLYLGSPFPAQPPSTYFHSWTGHAGRINPNLYEDGKICLSLLGTWHSERNNEAWSTNRSTILQIIVSILGLVLVKEPYYNEAGFEVLHNTPDTLVPSALYSEKAYVLAKAFVKTALRSPPSSLEDVITWLYIDASGPKLLSRIIDDCERLQRISEQKNGDENSVASRRTDNGWGADRISTGALILLKKNLDWLVRYAETHQNDLDADDAME